ncbi:MAG: helix-turn-helix domain-containing protein, partial [Thermanaerothrix sp.]|nr:helix-turn-helix domain-containing protein [Thermanaerothrix sp.]
LANPGVTLPYEDLGRLVYGCSMNRSEAACLLSPVASRLRRKLEQVDGNRWLRNQRQLGYSLQIASTPGPLIE